MFGRIQSGIFGGRQRSSVAPAPQQQERPRSPFPLPLGPPAPPRELPFPDALHGERPPDPVYVHPFWMRNRSIDAQVAQLYDNRRAVQQLIPRTNVIVKNPDGRLMYAGQRLSREEESAKRQYEKKMSERDNRAKGGVIKSYGIGSSSLKEMGRAVRDPNLKLNEFVKVAKTGQPLEVVRGQNAEVQARQPPRPRPRQVGPRR